MFNTLKYAHKLEEAGFSRLQAEASINILEEVMNENLATKQDIIDLRIATKQDLADLNNKIDSIKHDLKFEITHLESRMTIKMGTMMVALVAVIATIQKILFQ